MKHRFTARPRPSVQTCVRRAILAAAALVAAAMPVAGVMAQTSGSYPNKPVHILVGFPAGGPVDTLARAIGQKLSESMGQSVGSVIRSLRLFPLRQTSCRLPFHADDPRRSDTKCKEINIQQSSKRRP